MLRYHIVYSSYPMNRLWYIANAFKITQLYFLAVLTHYAPINILLHYPSLGQCMGNTGEFLNKKCAPRVGNLTSNLMPESNPQSGISFDRGFDQPISPNGGIFTHLFGQIIDCQIPPFSTTAPGRIGALFPKLIIPSIHTILLIYIIYLT